MLPQLADWRLDHRADGFTLTPPTGRAGGGIRVHERRRPLTTMRGLIAGIMTAPPFSDARPGRIERLDTREGELAALVTLEGAGYQRTVGAIFADDFYTTIDGVTTRPEAFARFGDAIRELTLRHSLGLGERRTRRYRHQPPARWTYRPRGLAAVWRLPGGGAEIVVHPARPHGAGGPTVMDQRRLAGFRRLGLEEPTPLATARLTGGSFRMSGTRAGRPEPIDVVVVALADDRFDYVLELEHTPEAAVEAGLAFTRIVTSVEPVPRPAADLGASTQAVFWTE